MIPPQSVLQQLFSGDVVGVAGRPEIVDDQLYWEELAQVCQAVPKRRAEFGTARVLARRALAALGIESQALLPGKDRAPTWPAGVVGSISHTNGYCGVVIARSPPHLSLGLDVEEERILDPEVVRLICTARELRALAEHGAHEQQMLPLLYFSAKEAFYKCQYPMTRRFLDFQDVELELDSARGRFLPTVIKAPPIELSGLFDGRFLRRDGLVFCGAELYAPEVAPVKTDAG